MCHIDIVHCTMYMLLTCTYTTHTPPVHTRCSKRATETFLKRRKRNGKMNEVRKFCLSQLMYSMQWGLRATAKSAAAAAIVIA